MISRGFNNVVPFALEGSYFDRSCNSSKKEVFSSKSEALSYLKSQRFNVLFTNGFPYILPSTLIKYLETFAKCINVHPSPLPELRGVDPVNGSILFNRPTGATVHQIDSGIDTGPIISQISFKVPKNFDLESIYPFVFRAEVLALKKALEVNLKAVGSRYDISTQSSYYTVSHADRIFDLNMPYEQISRIVRGFSTKSRPALLRHDINLFPVLKVEIIPADMINALELIDDTKNKSIMLFSDKIICRCQDNYILLTMLAEANDYSDPGYLPSLMLV